MLASYGNAFGWNANALLFYASMAIMSNPKILRAYYRESPH
jgi:hypothetical protein